MDKYGTENVLHLKHKTQCSHRHAHHVCYAMKGSYVNYILHSIHNILRKLNHSSIYSNTVHSTIQGVFLPSFLRIGSGFTVTLTRIK